MKTIKVLGHSDERLTKVGFGTELKNFAISDAVQISADRASASYQYLRDLQDDDVVELIFEDDIHRWVTVAELEKDYKYSLLRGESTDVIEIPPQLPTSTSPQTSRGATAWVLKALRVLKFDVVEMAAREIAVAWDKKLMPEPGLYRYQEQLSKRGEALDNPRVKADKPILLFLHGTFSSTLGSFGGLPKEVWSGLSKQYGDQIFGFDHRTLSQNPIQNALELVDKLPQNAKLHLVTHSRGGLIGEVLCRSGRKGSKDKEPFDDADSKLIAPHEQGLPEEQTLRELSKRLKSKNIKVERFVRIACPARGTTLVSGRLDRWLEVFVNVLDKVLEPTAGTILGVVTDLLLELKKQAANPLAIPGLAVMVPESGFIRMVNRPDVQVDVNLCVIAGDIEKSDILGRLAIFFTDRFYDEDHDLVVQTRAMYGGTAHEDGFYYFHKGTEVNHFHYFSNRKTAEKILEALTLTFEPQELKSKGFRPLSEAYRGEAIADIDLVARSYQKRSNISQPVVYIVPGIMGTHLAERGNRIWLDLFEMAGGGIANLQITNKDITPYSLVALAYAKLIDYLSATHEAIPFPYDWRISILDEAKRFGKVIEQKLGETNQPIRIVAHSMGGLVTRAMISSCPEVWEEICKRKGSRFLMLGTPNKGAHKITRLLLGQEQTLRMLAMLDLKNSPLRFLEILSRFPGVLQLLPMEQEPWDYLEASTWGKFPNSGKSAWIRPAQEDLEEAKKLRAILSASKFTEQDPVAYVAGFAQGAPVGLNLEDDGKITFLGTNEGDGTVPWRSGILPELENRTWYMNAPHGDMANHKDSFAAIYDLLQEGTTTRLSKVPPRVARSMEETYVLQEEPVRIYPAQVDLELSVLGANLAPLSVPTVEPVKVSVAHGNLSFCNNPVAVGHYEGDGIFSAEKDLDYHLSGRLTMRHKLGLYPGPEVTAEVILNDARRKPSGAIIVGLGKAGELSPRKLTQSFANAMREYAIKAAENKILGEEGKLAVSTLLIGAGGMGLSVTNSVDAILNGVVQANRSFSQIEGALQHVRISEIQFIELFKDQAILAARALRNYTNKPEFAVDPLLRSLRGGFQRLAYEEAPGWWSRIHVRAGENNSLIFTLPTERARAEESQLGVQRTNIENLVAQAVRDPKWDQRQATAIFELMIPNRLKGSFRDLNNVLLVLDPVAAHYPWELLYDRRSGEDKPLVVQVGMIRQFSTSVFQERVLDVNNRNILVVGNPANTPEGFADLPGAQQEANLVAAKFREHKYEVIQEINTGSNAIMNSLFANDYRILHLAGHGVYRYKFPVERTDEEKPDQYTGMVLGNGVFLTASEIRKKMEIPELVFVNCCHLGTTDSPAGSAGYAFNEFAASLSEALINMGVKAVIAAGWAVDDAAAITFADVFYEHLLKGAEFGEAVQAARKETYELHKDRTNTWAAYQCYGDPAYRLAVSREDGGRADDKFVHLEEACLEIRKLTGRAKATSSQGFASLRKNLSSLEQRIKEECPPIWLDDSSLQEALGEAFAEMLWFDKAIEYYQLAIENKNCAASIKAIEQLANCRIRLALQTFQTDPRYYKTAKSIIEGEIADLRTLITTLGKTSERWSLVGSGYKRLALLSSSKSSKACDLALKEMETAYDSARECAPDNTYPLTNALVAKVIRLLRASDPEEVKARLPELIKLTEAAASLAEKKRDISQDDFWASIGVIDVSMISHLLKYIKSGHKAIDEKLIDELVEEYQDTWIRYGSARELNSVIEQYTFLIAALEGIDRHKKLVDSLAKMLSKLNSIPE